MSIKCFFGAACISIMGSSIPEDDARYLFELCHGVSSYPLTSYILQNGQYRPDQQGYFLLDQIEEAGLDVRWKPSHVNNPSGNALANHRRGEALKLCRQISSVISKQ